MDLKEETDTVVEGLVTESVNSLRPESSHVHAPGNAFPTNWWRSSFRPVTTNSRPIFRPQLVPSRGPGAVRPSYAPRTAIQTNYPGLRHAQRTIHPESTRVPEDRRMSFCPQSVQTPRTSLGTSNVATGSVMPVNMKGRSPTHAGSLCTSMPRSFMFDNQSLTVPTNPVTKTKTPSEMRLTAKSHGVSHISQKKLPMTSSSGQNCLNVLLKTEKSEVKLLNERRQQLDDIELSQLEEMSSSVKYSKKDCSALKQNRSFTKSNKNVKNKKQVKIIQYEEQLRNTKCDEPTYLESTLQNREQFDVQLEALQETMNPNYKNQQINYEYEDEEFDMEDSTNIKMLLEKNDLSEEIKSSIAKNVEKLVVSENRLELGAKEFFSESAFFLEQFVSAAFEEHRCCRCEKEALITCGECGNLCTEHDISFHTGQPLHIRYAGTMKLEAGVTVDEIKLHLVSFPVLLPVRSTKKCQCGASMDINSSTEASVRCLDTSGAFEAKPVVFKCVSCLSLLKASVKDYFSSKLFPLDCNNDSKLFVTFRLLELWRQIKNNCPQVGQGAFLKSITTSSLIEVKQSEMDQCYEEYNHLHFKMGKRLGETYKDCPAKKSQSTRVHTDGNSKLSRFFSKFQRKGMKFSYYGDEVIMNDDLVRRETEKYKDHKLVSSKRSDNVCGESRWKAGENKTTHSSVIDEKGINFTACSHYVILQAINQPFGEIYALHSMGIANVAQRGYNVGDVSLDVACKFSSWNEKQMRNKDLQNCLCFTPSHAPFWIGNVHSKGHSYWCRICFGHLWNGIGRGSAGEQVEVLNSPLSQLRFRTRFMGTNRRNDEITELILYKNKETDENIVHNIVNTLERYEKESDQLKEDLACFEVKNNFCIDYSKIEVIKNVARKVLSAKKEDIEEKIEVYSMSVIQKRSQLKSNLDSAMRNKVKLNLEGANKKLNQAIENYNNEHIVPVLLENALLGIFPWNTRHLPEEMREDPATFLKAAEMYLKLKRTNEETPILIDDLRVILEKRVTVIEWLSKPSGDTVEWKKAKFMKSAILKEQLNSEIQLIRSAPHLMVSTEHLKGYMGEGRPLFRCTHMEESLEEIIEVVHDE